MLGVDPARCGRGDCIGSHPNGFVFQQFGLVGRLSAMENVLMGAFGSLRMPRYGISSYPGELRERAAANLERVGLLDERYQRCDTLSGGQQQRVASRGRSCRRPSSCSRTSRSRRWIQRERLGAADAEKLSAEDGFTVICSLHQVELALEVSDRVVAVREGSFVLDAPTAETTEEEIRAVYAQAKRD